MRVVLLILAALVLSTTHAAALKGTGGTGGLWFQLHRWWEMRPWMGPWVQPTARVQRKTVLMGSNVLAAGRWTIAAVPTARPRHTQIPSRKSLAAR